MSLYPYWALDSGLETDEEEAITHCMRNIVHVWEKYRTPVMIVETGFEVDESHPEVMDADYHRPVFVNLLIVSR